MNGAKQLYGWTDLSWLNLLCVVRPAQEEEVTLCMEPESIMLTPPTQQGDASGGSSPGQPPAEQITERKASDVTSGLIQTLEEKEEEEEGPAASMATNWVPGCQETRNYKLTRESARNERNNTTYIY